ncbi:MAG: glycosyltransferase [Flavobacteriales bacterium]|nr:glycosyltransferase [Flavobacteriales bacterium]
MISSSEITFIIPCYNESHRLDVTRRKLGDLYAIHPDQPGIIFVNDGSTDDTESRLHDLCEHLQTLSPGIPFRTISYPNNKGKGWALYQGIQQCETPWCITLDADLATGPEEWRYWNEKGWIGEEDNKVYIGSREKGIQHRIVRYSWFRRSIGLAFNRLVRMYTRMPFDDTQCGFKCYPTAIARAAFENLNDYSFAHDVEVLMNIHHNHIPIVSLPVHWNETAGSKVNVFRDGFQMFRTIRGLRSKS